MACHWLTRQEVAAYLRVNVSTVNRMVNDGRIRPYKLGNRVVRYCLTELQENMAAANNGGTDGSSTD